MISRTSYQKEWIYSLSEKIGKRGDLKILEKVIHAFTLLEQLTAVGLDFVFKGGTSLLLLADPPRRFSIDIDIITQISPDGLREVLEKVVSLGIFTRWEDDSLRKHATDIPAGHYKLYYKSQVSSIFGDEPILLDVLFTPNPYPVLVEKSIQHEWFQSEGEILATRIPAIEAITGDKLTAFAPNTTGILYTKDRPVEIIKQLYDLGFLFEHVRDFKLLREAYIRVAKEEIKYRKLDITLDEVLQDTSETCLLIAQREANNDDFKHIQKGIINIVNFVLDRFHIEEAVVCASKVAYMCRIIRDGITMPERYTNPQQIADYRIEKNDYTLQRDIALVTRLMCSTGVIFYPKLFQ